MFKSPKKPKLKLSELKNDNPDLYKLLQVCLMFFAKDLDNLTHEGIERSLEVLESMLDSGWMKLIFNKEKDIIKLGFWDPKKRIYVIDENIIENDNLINFLKEFKTQGDNFE